MGRASLSYFIKDKNIVLYSDMLKSVDMYTSRYNNAKELYDSINSSYIIDDFIKENNRSGKFKVVYIDRGNITRVLPVLYKDEEIYVDDVASTGIVSESEKARKRLLNSKEQLFSKLFLLNKDVDNAKKVSVEVSYDEAMLLKNSGVYTYSKNGSYFVSMEDLIRYRASHTKLGKIRAIYEEALDIWKENMDSLSYDDIYFLSREYRIIENNYNKVREKGISINNLDIVKENIPRINGSIRVRSNTPYLLHNKNKKIKKYIA